MPGFLTAKMNRREIEMKKIAVLLTVLLSVSLVGCANFDKERVKSSVKGAVAKMKFWDKDADQYTVTITNLSTGTYLTPILAVGHSDTQAKMFAYGKAASPELQAAAEGGDIEALAAQFEAAGAEVVRNPAGDLLGPGELTTFNLSLDHTRISLISMMLPTNDGFVALDNAKLHVGAQYLYAIDAGTEANDERITGGGAPNTPGIPADPGGNANADASGIASAKAEGSVDRHPGIMGGEGSALDPEVHGWNGPIASVDVSM